MSTDATLRMDRFAAYVDGANISEVPRTIVVYQADGKVITTAELPVDRDVMEILSLAEQSIYGTVIVREFISRMKASAVLLAHVLKLSPNLRKTLGQTTDLSAVTTAEVLLLHYESATAGEIRTYPVNRDGGAIRLGTYINANNPRRRFAKDFL